MSGHTYPMAATIFNWNDIEALKNWQITINPIFSIQTEGSPSEVVAVHGISFL